MHLLVGRHLDLPVALGLVGVVLRVVGSLNSDLGMKRQKYITPPTISFVWILFGLLHREPK